MFQFQLPGGLTVWSIPLFGMAEIGVVILLAPALACGVVLAMLRVRLVALPEGECALLVDRHGRPRRVLTPADRWHLRPRRSQVWLRSEFPVLGSQWVNHDALDARPFDLFLTVLRAGPDERLVLIREGQPLFLLDRGESVAVWNVVLRNTERFRFDATRIEDVPARVAMALQARQLGYLVTELEVPDDEFGVVSVEGMQPAILGEGRHRFLNWGAAVSLQPIDRRRVGRA